MLETQAGPLLAAPIPKKASFSVKHDLHGSWFA
jgi:hypothetical protein